MPVRNDDERFRTGGEGGFTAFVTACVKDNTVSNDMHLLQKMYDKVPVFVYGAEKEGFSCHNLLMKQFRRIGTGRTVANTFVMYKSNAGQPIAMMKPLLDVSGHIRGELYILPIEYLFDLDCLYDLGMAFYRTTREVMYFKEEDRNKSDKRLHCTTAFVYHGLGEFFGEKIKSGELTIMKRYAPLDDGKAFYNFSMADDKPNRDRRAM